MEPKFPNAHVQLVGQDGNAFFIIGRARKALRNAGASADDIEAFCEDAMSGNYDHVLRTVMEWCATS